MTQDTDVHSYLKTFEESGRFILVASLYPEMTTPLERQWLRDLVGAPSAKDKTGLGKLIGLAKEVVSKRFESENPEQMDMLGKSVM